MFNKNDLRQIKAKGIELLKIEKQINFFREGFPFIKLIRPATINDGIISLNDEIRTIYINLFEESLKEIKIVKFVPASGAASRMFKHLFEFMNKSSTQKINLQDCAQDQSFNSVYYFLSHLQEIGFYPILSAAIQKEGVSINELISNNEYGNIIEYILTPKGLDYSSLPKALIGFHWYPGEIRTSAEEHLVEAANYAKGRNNIARIHFTISPEHRVKMDNLLTNVKSKYEERYGVGLEITFSVQKQSTDTLAVDEFNEPCRDQSGGLLFRPGGHGAILENLNEIDADLIFIKNIDNVVPDRLKEPTFIYKKLIGGYLLHIQRKIFTFLGNADHKQITHKDILETEKFAREMLNLTFPEDFHNMDIESQIKFLVSQFNRPVRVCGMVKNEGEPGGGPFWVSDRRHQQNLQIVESSQIDFNDENQKKIFNTSTHFNPVDLVCSTKDYKGKPFRLMQYSDEETGLISLKSSGGKTLKAQELPGLWNGAMSDWITVFIEVPIITFNPVKLVNDLLRKEHLIA